MNETSIVNADVSVTHDQAVLLIINNPDIRFMVRGEPGVGKTALALEIEQRLGILLAMIDVPQMDIGDAAMPVIDHDARVTRYYPNARFRLTEGKPVLIVLDEYTKGGEAIQNMLHPMLEINNPRLGDVSLPNGSIVYMTGNLDTDGVGDGLQQHTRQRIAEIHLSKPTAQQWISGWATRNDVDPLLMAWVDRYPQCLASYVDGMVNEFNFNPANPDDNVVSPRTLALASKVIKQREIYKGKNGSQGLLLAALTGIAGAAFAHSFVSFLKYQDALPSLRSIEEDPMTAIIPPDAGGRAVLTFGLLARANAENFDNILKYFTRMDEEFQVIFSVCLAKEKDKQQFMFRNKGFMQWMVANQDLLG
tara:strand:- start:5124 stop:6212 length:1089 start_codon:yes stop_codon:yes gene_type:complete